MFRETFTVQTEGSMTFTDITGTVADIVAKCKVNEGLCNIFLPATTAGFIMNENDGLLIEDFKKLFNLVNEERVYNHPSNAFSHLRANLTSTEKTIPIEKGKLMLGTWQSILLFEFDIKPRNRSIIITIIEDKRK